MASLQIAAELGLGQSKSLGLTGVNSQATHAIGIQAERDFERVFHVITRHFHCEFSNRATALKSFHAQLPTAIDHHLGLKIGLLSNRFIKTELNKIGILRATVRALTSPQAQWLNAGSDGCGLTTALPPSSHLL